MEAHVLKIIRFWETLPLPLFRIGEEQKYEYK